MEIKINKIKRLKDSYPESDVEAALNHLAKKYPRPVLKVEGNENVGMNALDYEDFKW